MSPFTWTRTGETEFAKEKCNGFERTARHSDNYQYCSEKQVQVLSVLMWVPWLWPEGGPSPVRFCAGFGSGISASAEWLPGTPCVPLVWACWGVSCRIVAFLSDIRTAALDLPSFQLPGLYAGEALSELQYKHYSSGGRTAACNGRTELRQLSAVTKICRPFFSEVVFTLDIPSFEWQRLEESSIVSCLSTHSLMGKQGAGCFWGEYTCLSSGIPEVWIAFCGLSL